MSDYEEAMVAAVSAIIKMEMAGHTPRLSQQDVAEQVGIHRETLSRYLGGKKEMPVGTFFQVAQVLGVSAAEIMERAEDRVRRTQP